MKTPGIVSVSPARTLVQKILICGRCFFLLHLVLAIIAGRRMRKQSPALDFIERQARISQSAQQRAHVSFILDGLEDMERCLPAHDVDGITLDLLYHGRGGARTVLDRGGVRARILEKIMLVLLNITFQVHMTVNSQGIVSWI